MQNFLKRLLKSILEALEYTVKIIGLILMVLLLYFYSSTTEEKSWFSFDFLVKLVAISAIVLTPIFLIIFIGAEFSKDK